MSEERDSPSVPSNTQLDKLGDRLRAGSTDEADLRALDEYRRSFRSAFDAVVSIVKTNLEIECTGRPAKTTAAIVDKLRRQRIRLTQIQDIAGLRLVVGSVIEQDRVIAQLNQVLLDASVYDRRTQPSHGYRAVHLVVPINDRLVEIQVRTHVQHLWAELSEKLSDVVDPAVKYGGGPPSTRDKLVRYSLLVAEIENGEAEDARAASDLASRESELQEGGREGPNATAQRVEIAELREQQSDSERFTQSLKKSLAELLSTYYNDLTKKI